MLHNSPQNSAQDLPQSSRQGPFKSSLRRLRTSWTLHEQLDRRWTSELLALGMLGVSALPLPLQRKLALRVAAARRTETAVSQGLTRRLVRPWLQGSGNEDVWRDQRVGWGRYFGGVADINRDRPLTTSLVLKEPGPDGEKGVLYSSFEFNWMRIIANHDARAFLKNYLLVGASSWSPSDHAVLASLQGLSDDPAFIGISNLSDMAQYRIWSPGVEPLQITAGDWINPDYYQPVPQAERSIDIIMVSHFAKWKRHWLLFEALRKMRPDLRVVLIGRDCDGRTERDLRREAKIYGLKQDIEIHKKLEIDEVTALQCDARVAVALSKREGSCVAVTEAMFADTPVVLMDDAHVGTRAYVNASTGRIASRRNLPQVLEHMLAHREEFSPAQWAREHISAQATSQRLNDILRNHCVARGLPWTRDIVPMCWRYVPSYLNPADEARMQPAVERLQQEHGIVLSRFTGERPLQAGHGLRFGTPLRV